MAFDKRKNVFGWVAEHDGCGFYRLKQPLRELQASSPDNYSTAIGRILPGDYADYDVIIGQRVCVWDDQADPVKRFIRLTLDFDQLTVYEIDDNLFEVPENNPAHNWFSQEAVQINMGSCAEAADLVTVSTEPLAEVMRKHNPNVVVIPNYIDESVLQIPRPDNQRLIIGWGGTSTHLDDFASLDDALDRVMLRNPNVIFQTIGSKLYGENLPKNRVMRKPWILSTQKIYPHIARFDIGIAPLAPSVFNESKSWIKVLEYMGLGIPSVAGDFGPYRDLIKHGETGFLAKTPADWEKYLSLLINSEEIRLKMGEAARRQAEELTIQGQIWRYESAYEG